ncbi:hypothetical protein NQ315_015998 [Exocentrus adspersus]|uniref:STAS domain-containing protein n=1 Tax=Exocentrus adspersus TaxID=1586481 RepID=A0AAV8VLC8_9CUCU|nr:hypothetical protein NQ315_015998 [Exocentrus adspersus]
MRIPWNYFRKYIPILQWGSEYNVDKAVSDLVAGITVGLTLIPQSLAYASLAGLEPQYGLYSSLCGGLIYVVFGAIPELSIAPTALLSLLTYSYTKDLSFDHVQGAILLCFLAGCLELVCGLFHLGFLVDFVSTPVVAAFTSAGAITIATSQVKNLFGLKFQSEQFLDTWKNFFIHIAEVNKTDTALGLSCCVVLLAMRKLKDYGTPPLASTKKEKEKYATLKKIVWFISVARNAMVVIGCAVIAFVLNKYGEKPFSLTSKVPSGWPNVSLPSFQIEQENKTLTFVDMASELGTGILVVPFIAIIANVGIAKAFSKGKVLDASQEMIAVGLCNIIGSLFGSYPVNASFSRAAVGGASGVKTPIAGIYTAIMVFLAFTLLTPYFSFIPKPTLSAVIICAVIFMVEVMMTKLIWKVNRLDMIPFVVTLISCLILGIEMGILIGILVDILKLLYVSARPKILVEKIPVEKDYYIKVTPTTSILFSSAEYVREKIIFHNVEMGENCTTVVIDCHRIINMDFTSVKCLGDLIVDLTRSGKKVVLLSLRDDLVGTLQKVHHGKLATVQTQDDLEKYLIVVLNRVPILRWGRLYNSKKLLSDTIAGFTVGLTVMPQALAYATLAGLEPQYGLYSAFAGCFVYTIFGSIKDITIGPTALMALMTYQQVVGRNTDYAVLLCFLSGIVQMIMAILRLGVLIDFISIPVTVGFTSATSLIIIASQLKSLLGLKIKASGFLDTLTKVVNNIHMTRLKDLALGVTCIVILMLLRKLKDVKLHKDNEKPTKNQNFLNYILWLVSTSRNAIVVIVCSGVAYYYEKTEAGSPFLLTGTVKPGLPELKLPPFETVLGNRTVDFVDMVTDLGSSVVLVPVIAVLGNVAIAKAFASGSTIDATQELFTLSMCNFIGSFFSSMPITGSFSRSAVNHASGVQTPFGGIITGIMVLLALSFLTPYFAFIPKASLAAVIISAVIFMIEYEVVKPMWRTSKKDLISTFATFVACLVIGVEYGILLGVGINIMFLLYPSARPTVYVDQLKTANGVEYIMITPGNSLYFPAIDFIKTSIAKAGLCSKNLPVVVDCRYILGADFTAAKGILALINEFVMRKQPLYFVNARKEVVSVFEGVMQGDFKYFKSNDELEQQLEEHAIDRVEEQDSLLSFEKEYFPKSNDQCVELKEVTYGEGLNRRKNSR